MTGPGRAMETSLVGSPRSLRDVRDLTLVWQLTWAV
jgi:hypothetical protein